MGQDGAASLVLKSQPEVEAEAGSTPAGRTVPLFRLTRHSSQEAGAPLGSAELVLGHGRGQGS